jgi:hypothetical protein
MPLIFHRGGGITAIGEMSNGLLTSREELNPKCKHFDLAREQNFDDLR